jgi:hypothetical protein
MIQKDQVTFPSGNHLPDFIFFIDIKNNLKNSFSVFIEAGVTEPEYWSMIKIESGNEQSKRCRNIAI